MKRLNENQFIVNRRNILDEQRYTMKRLGLDIGVSGTTINNAITCKVINYSTQKKIVEKLGMTIIQFWPELYGDPQEESGNNTQLHEVGALQPRL